MQLTMTTTTHTTNANAMHARATLTTAFKFSDAPFFADEANPADKIRHQTLEVITRFLIWIAEGANTQNRGARATVALYCVRPDLIKSITLEQIGHMAGMTRQSAYSLARDFRLSMGL